MKAGLVGAAKCHVLLDPSIPYVGVDGGVQTLVDQHISPMFVVGDFDSIKNTKLIETFNHIRLPMRKDDTDTQVAIEYLIEKGYNDIVLYGVTGGRLDHFMAIICLLQKFRQYKLSVIDEQNKIYLLKSGTHIIKKEMYKYISFFACQEVCISIQGCQYALNEYVLTSDNPLCVSNEIKEEQCTITISSDVIVVQSNNGRGT